MNRYINVSEDAVRGIFKKLNHKNIYPKSSDEIILRNYLDEFPTADVQEVVHGEWIKTTIPEWCGTDELHRSVYRDREIVKCSECGNPSPVYNIEFEFCPRCGAKMDGKK